MGRPLLRFLGLLLATATCVAIRVAAKEAGERRRGAGDPYCLSKDADPYTGFATMTPYRLALDATMEADQVVPTGCTPVQMWHLIRHGSHGAHKNDQIKMKDDLPLLKRKIFRTRSQGEGNMCDQDLELIRSWKVKDMKKREGYLTEEGKRELGGIARRFLSAFPELLKKKFSIRFKPGDGNEIAFASGRQNYESARVYIAAMYGRYAKYVAFSAIASKTLQFFDYCKNYGQSVLDIEKDLKPYHVFKELSLMSSVLRSVSERLGFSVSVSDVRSMYNACRYIGAWRPKRLSPWCAVFTPQDLQVLEYWEDLRMYFDHGYAHSISSEQSCVLGKDLVEQFRNRVGNGSTEIYYTTYIVNPEALVSFMTFLGLFRDEEPLTEHSIPESRLWKTSGFAGYGSNMALLLSSCDNGGFWVSALVNEKAVKLPGCTSSLGCPWETFTENFAYLEEGDFRKLCGAYSRTVLKSYHRYAYYMNEDWM
ncbi:multiple inositol polyphosphate phosphatase 1-like [Penaeus japonicus]|uniref:multiple inositol polyphosphate phosphatase 1-like n=1 Tax=Penaeus japonicus TaxID=27405 RepID=UPI001C711199|nr:multiple inositol polyphosphate phosphatase 1-like [Penaeus japonicus]